MKKSFNFKKIKIISLLCFLSSIIINISVSGQNVGITNGSRINPNYLLQVHSTATSGPLLQLTNGSTLTSGSPAAGDGFIVDMDASAKVMFKNQEAGTMAFFTNGSERITILSGGNVGIGTTTPATKLDVNGSCTMTGFALTTGGAAGKVLTSDASGNGTWQTSTGWTISGNGSVDSTNFIGTTNNVPLNFKANNLKAGRIELGTGASVFLGSQAGNSNSATMYNTGIGRQALYSNTTGYKNTAIGYVALQYNTTGYNNTATGNASLAANTTGNNNTAYGYGSLLANTNGNNNTATGFLSLAYNTTGIGNTSDGFEALYLNTTGNYNTANGFYSLKNNTTGSFNTAIGYAALINQSYSNGGTEWSGYNVAIGTNALFTNNPTSASNGICNTAVGNNALYGNTVGLNNTAIGMNALNGNTTGNYNTASGRNALCYNKTGTSNTAYGSYSLFYNTTGNYNAALGYYAGFGSTTDTAYSACTFIGYGADANGNYTNATVIGYNAVVDASNKVVIGNTSVGWIGGQVGWSTLSDGRFKFNVTENVKGLEFIKKLRPVTYQMDTKRADDFLIQNMPDSIKTAHQEGMDFTPSTAIVRSGFIAQEVEQAANDCGLISSIVSAPADINTSAYSLGYAEIVVPLVKAVQELSKTTDSLKIHQVTTDGLLTIAGDNNLTNAIAIGNGAVAGVSNSIVLGGTGVNAINVGIGTATPTSKLQVVGLPEYPNNATAITAGLTVGAFYRTGDLLKVVH
ncbi:MAG: hypothetical protein HGB12_02695 [Bacteroidetes bacterium]|nr:hypothetical protein [Bacteroidota bacterium]